MARDIQSGKMTAGTSLLVSVIIPLYNAEKYISETIQSVLDQTWLNTEIIVIDDGSTDSSLAVAKSFESEKVKILSQENKGASAARNLGLSVAKGSYIQFLDADDLLSNDKISSQVLTLEEDPDKVAICDTIHFSDQSSHLNYTPSAYEQKFAVSDDNPAHFLTRLMGGYTDYGSMIPVHSWLVPLAIINKAGLWDEKLTVDDDGEYFCRVVLNAKGVVKASGYSYYRKYSSNYSLSAQRSLADITSRLSAVISKKKHLLKATDSIEARIAIYKALVAIQVDSYLQFPELYRRSITELPAINLKYTPSLGGNVSNFFAKLFGWRMLLIFKLYLKKWSR